MSINPQAQGAEGGSMSLSLAWQYNKILAQKNKRAASKHMEQNNKTVIFSS